MKHHQTVVFDSQRLTTADPSEAVVQSVPSAACQSTAVCIAVAKKKKPTHLIKKFN